MRELTQLDLLMKLMRRDTDAFLKMTDKYSWPVYSQIRKKVSDPEVADALFQKTMDGFYRSLHESQTDDPLEAMLLVYANGVIEKHEGASGEHIVYSTKTAEKTEKRRSGGFAAFLLLTAIVIVLWVIAGLLMDMNLIPAVDLGYAWFNANITQMF